MVPARNLPSEFDGSVLFESPGDGVQVDHDLGAAAGAVLAGLGVDDDGIVFPAGDDVGPAGQGCGSAVEFKPVLRLGVDVVATERPVGDAFVEEGGVVEEPPGLVGI